MTDEQAWDTEGRVRVSWYTASSPPSRQGSADDRVPLAVSLPDQRQWRIRRAFKLCTCYNR